MDDLHQALDDSRGVIHLQFLRGDRAVTREVAIRLARGAPWWRRRRDPSADRGALRDRARGPGIGGAPNGAGIEVVGAAGLRGPERGDRAVSTGRGAGRGRSTSRRAARRSDRAGGPRWRAGDRRAGTGSAVRLDRRCAALRHTRRAARRSRSARNPGGGRSCRRRTGRAASAGSFRAGRRPPTAGGATRKP